MLSYSKAFNGCMKIPLDLIAYVMSAIIGFPELPYSRTNRLAPVTFRRREVRCHFTPSGLLPNLDPIIVGLYLTGATP